MSADPLPLISPGVTPGDAVIRDHPKHPLQTVSGTDCTRRGQSPRQPVSRGSPDSFLISTHFFLFSHFCCSTSTPAHCHRGKETGKVKATHAQALPSPSPAPLQQRQILAAAAAASSGHCPDQPVWLWHRELHLVLTLSTTKGSSRDFTAKIRRAPLPRAPHLWLALTCL